MRREFSAKVKFAALKRSCDDKGIPRCEKCGIFLTAGMIRYDHSKPDGLGGEPTIDNCVVLCKTCHNVKTFTHDNPIMAKSDMQKKRHWGIKRKGKPMPGSRASGWKHKIDGTWEKR